MHMQQPSPIPEPVPPPGDPIPPGRDPDEPAPVEEPPTPIPVPTPNEPGDLPLRVTGEVSRSRARDDARREDCSYHRRRLRNPSSLGRTFAREGADACIGFHSGPATRRMARPKLALSR